MDTLSLSLVQHRGRKLLGLLEWEYLLLEDNPLQDHLASLVLNNQMVLKR